MTMTGFGFGNAGFDSGFGSSSTPGFWGSTAAGTDSFSFGGSSGSSQFLNFSQTQRSLTYGLCGGGGGGGGGGGVLGVTDFSCGSSASAFGSAGSAFGSGGGLGAFSLGSSAWNTKDTKESAGSAFGRAGSFSLGSSAWNSKGTKATRYSPTAVDGLSYNDITAMGAYLHKSHEELRWEDCNENDGAASSTVFGASTGSAASSTVFGACTGSASSFASSTPSSLGSTGSADSGLSFGTAAFSSLASPSTVLFGARGFTQSANTKSAFELGGGASSILVPSAGGSAFTFGGGGPGSSFSSGSTFGGGGTTSSAFSGGSTFGGGGTSSAFSGVSTFGCGVGTSSAFSGVSTFGSGVGTSSAFSSSGSTFGGVGTSSAFSGVSTFGSGIGTDRAFNSGGSGGTFGSAGGATASAFSSVSAFGGSSGATGSAFASSTNSGFGNSGPTESAFGSSAGSFFGSSTGSASTGSVFDVSTAGTGSGISLGIFSSAGSSGSSFGSDSTITASKASGRTFASVGSDSFTGGFGSQSAGTWFSFGNNGGGGGSFGGFGACSALGLSSPAPASSSFALGSSTTTATAFGLVAFGSSTISALSTGLPSSSSGTQPRHPDARVATVDSDPFALHLMTVSKANAASLPSSSNVSGVSGAGVASDSLVVSGDRSGSFLATPRSAVGLRAARASSRHNRNPIIAAHQACSAYRQLAYGEAWLSLLVSRRNMRKLGSVDMPPAIEIQNDPSPKTMHSKNTNPDSTDPTGRDTAERQDERVDRKAEREKQSKSDVRPSTTSAARDKSTASVHIPQSHKYRDTSLISISTAAVLGGVRLGSGVSRESVASALGALSLRSAPSSAPCTAVLAPKMVRQKYLLSPSLAELQVYSAQELQRVQNFKVTHPDFGSVRWQGDTDVSGVDLDSHIEFGPGYVELYPGDSDTPPAGQKLNKRACVTLFNCWPIAGKVSGPRQRVTDQSSLHRYEKRLRLMADKWRAHFQHYNRQSGEWSFWVDSF